MIKIVWFLKRAEHLSLAQFRDWWINEHAPAVAAYQQKYLRRYEVNVRSEDNAAGQPAEPFDWDGYAVQWFDSMEALNECYGRPESPTRADTLAHTSRFARLIVQEHGVSIKS